MTNAMIILKESVRLMNDGILEGTGQYMTFVDADGTAREQEVPEDIHTFTTWKNLGYSVKKGERAIAKFSIWKHTSQTIVDENDEEHVSSRMFLKSAAFFKGSQVEKIEY